jgi:hypothetical protein
MQRRQILKAGDMAAAAVGLGVLGYQYLAPSANAAQLFRSLNTDRIHKLVVDYHHPLRQYHKASKVIGSLCPLKAAT